ncbi:MAG TPA: serine/threonine-protein kinase [Pyrinomonadaceae bacterium]|jgi:serine/threonine protein kinase
MTRNRQAQQSLSDVAQAWLRSKTRASIEGINLLPQENTYLAGNPLVIARGQAQAFYLHDETRRVWILKKFLPGRNPNAQYIKAIQSLIPMHPGFESGYQRKVLSRASAAGASLPAAEFPAWIENTILMPLVPGSHWAYIADRVRDGTIRLTPEQRLSMCRSLSEKIAVLESHGLSHRDLSSTNIFIDTDTWAVHLIDWDSIYHDSLTMPPNTTFGTSGYVAPFVRVSGVEDAQATWARGTDRFSMGVLNVEFLSVERDSPVTGDGGIFDQDEIYNSGGSGIDKITGRLRRDFPSALALFGRILHAAAFDKCPSPDEWRALGAGVTAPSLKDVYDPQPDFMRFIQRMQIVPPKIERPAPDLRDMAAPDFHAPHVPATKDGGPPAPSLTELGRPDWGQLSLRPAPESARPAPRLDELEDPFADANQERRE